MCDGRGYNNYTVEVVDRVGTNSFTPDSGVLLAKTKDVDAANRLHFYITNRHRDDLGNLSYTVAIKSLDGAGPAKRGVRLLPTVGVPTQGVATCTFPLTNTGKATAPAGQHPEDVSKYLDADVYRLSARADGRGWSVNLPNALTTAKTGQRIAVPVQALHTPNAATLGRVTLTATSESDPTKTATTTCLAIAK